MLATQDIPVSKLIGSTVYGPDDSTLGEVGDVILDKEGAIQAIEVDVGGFLGFGEKPVAVGFDAVNVQTDANGNMLVMVKATKDQLDSAPAYDEVTVQ
jgi:sporulation protein YlmC with PRC-barrel domain